MDLQNLGFVTLFLLLWNQNIFLQILTYRAQKQKTRSWWVRPINRKKRQAFMHNLFRELKSINNEEFFVYTRLSLEQFQTLLQLVTPYLRKISIKKTLSPETRLAITLAYLTQGDSVVSKHLEYRVGRSTVHKIIPEVCHAIWLALQPIVAYIKC